MRKPLSIIYLSIGAMLACFTSVFAADSSSERSIAEVEDFSQLTGVMGKKRLPLVLMFSSEYCVFCRRVENDFLIPMQISGDYRGRALIRKIKIDYGNTVRDFDGEMIDADEFAARYNVTVTPTVVFLDESGHQVAPKRVGLTTPDFYGGYLDESIDIAVDMLRRDRPIGPRLSAAN